MRIADLVFLLLLFTAVVSLVTAAVFGIRGRRERCQRTLARVASGALAYMGVVVLASVVLPRRVLPRDARECFDDWCLGVARSTRRAAGGGVAFDVELRLTSRARRVAQRENNLAVYLTDSGGHRHDPVSGAAPLNVLLQPGESVVVPRSFVVPPGTSVLGLVVTHEGGFPIAWFLIGYDSWFRLPTVIELEE